MIDQSSAKQESTFEPIVFSEGTIGAFLQEGEQGWPEAFAVEVDGAHVSVSASQLRRECQQCSCKAAGDAVSYVRIVLDFEIERDGVVHQRHIEDLYPIQALEVLDTPLDETASVRVRGAIEETFEQLRCQGMDQFLADTIAPMRLYEPILNALLPRTATSFVSWLHAQLLPLLGADDGYLVDTESGACRIRVHADDIRMREDLRRHGEVQLVGHIEVQCARTGKQQGFWKSQAVLFGGISPRELAEMPGPQRCEQFRTIARSWCEELSRNVIERIERGEEKLSLSDILPQRPLIESLFARRPKRPSLSKVV